MKSTTKILLYSLCFLAVLSCRKEKSFTVKVYNPVTGEGIPYSTVYITETANSSNCLFCSPDAEEFYNGVTDENGMLVIDEDFHKNYQYDLYIGTDIESCYTYGEHEGHKASGPKISLDNKDLAGSTVYYEVVPCAELKLKINNVNCQGVDDEMRFKKNNLDAVDDFNGWSSYRTGCYSYESPNYFDVAMGNIEYEWEVTRNGITNVFRDTFYLSEGEQRIYEINY